MVTAPVLLLMSTFLMAAVVKTVYFGLGTASTLKEQSSAMEVEPRVTALAMGSSVPLYMGATGWVRGCSSDGE